MPWDNSLNPAKGRDFQRLAADMLSSHFVVPFGLDIPIPIGNPPKAHRFDLVSEDRQVVGECKSYSWTETGNMPSAKMAFLNGAVLYLSLLPVGTHKFIVMRLDPHEKRGETLVQHYLRTYRHLIGGLTFFEIDAAAHTLVEHKI